jgi:hypothetical protein
MATQRHLTRQFGISLRVPLLCQVRPPNRHHRVASRPGLLNTAHRAPSVVGTPTIAPSLIGGWPSGHSQRYFSLLLLATWFAGGLLECHSFESLGSFATDRHGQNLPALELQYGQTVWPPYFVKWSILASQSCCLPHSWMQPGHRSQTFCALLCVKSAGTLPWLRVGCHIPWMSW